MQGIAVQICGNSRRKPLVGLSFVVLLTVLLAGCGSESPPPEPKEVSPPPQIEEDAPPPMEPGRLFLLHLDEWVSAPPVPGWAPWHRTLSEVSDEDLPAALRGDGANEDTITQVEAWLNGKAASKEEGVLIRWDIRWGEGGSSGTARFWDHCALPCTLEDPLVFQSSHHPTDPVLRPEALFALRPGASSVTLRSDVQGALVVDHKGDSRPLETDASLRFEDVGQFSVPLLSAGGTEQWDRELVASRRLEIRVGAPRGIEVTELRDAAKSTASPLPSLSEDQPPKPRLRAVEGVIEYWDWEGAKGFEGGFSVRPDPEDEGMFIERGEGRVRWTPTARQAGEGEANFLTYNIKRGPNEGGLSPFPEGAEVLAATSLFDGKLIVASLGTTDALARIEEVSDAFTAYRSVLPLHESVDVGTVIYLTDAPTAVQLGGPGRSSVSYSVSSMAGERESLAWLWAHLALGKASQYRSPEVFDWLLRARAALMELDDPSVWAHVFAGQGTDVLKVWEERLRESARSGRADPGDFIDYVRAQLPDLAESIVREVGKRRVLIAPELSASEPSSSLGMNDAAPAEVVAFAVPEEGFQVGSRLKWSLAKKPSGENTPVKEGVGESASEGTNTAPIAKKDGRADSKRSVEPSVSVFWHLALVSPMDWQWAQRRGEGRRLLVDKLFPKVPSGSLVPSQKPVVQEVELQAPKVAVLSLWSMKSHELDLRFELIPPELGSAEQALNEGLSD